MIVSGLKQCLYLFELNGVNTKCISVKKIWWEVNDVNIDLSCSCELYTSSTLV